VFLGPSSSLVILKLLVRARSSLTFYKEKLPLLSLKANVIYSNKNKFSFCENLLNIKVIEFIFTSILICFYKIFLQ
jgi:hypothetical protein